MVSCDYILDNSHKNDYNYFSVVFGSLKMNNELAKALEILYDMEKNNFFMNQSINALNSEIEKFAYVPEITKPKEVVCCSECVEGWVSSCVTVLAFIGAIVYSIYKPTTATLFDNKVLFWFIGLVLGAIFGALVGLLFVPKRRDIN